MPQNQKNFVRKEISCIAQKNNKDALKTYTEAIKLAPHYEEYRGIELSLAFANRSAVYFQMKLFR